MYKNSSGCIGSQTRKLKVQLIANCVKAAAPNMDSQVAPNTASDAQHDASPASCKVVLAQTVAKSLLTEVHANLKKLGRSPLLVGFLANTDPAARMYADWTAKTCKEK